MSLGMCFGESTLVDKIVCLGHTAPLDFTNAGQSLWLIIALPLLGAFISGVFGKWLGRANVHLVTCGAVFGSFLLSALVFWTIASHDATVFNAFGGDPTRYAVGADHGTWFAAGGFRVNLGLIADHLSGCMLLVITGVGFLIHVYSTSYMEHDPGYWKFFAYLNLFVAMMLTLVLADSLVLMFVGWEGVGMCSYLLIGFWYEDTAKAWAGRKAFITNRIGDFGFLVACFLLVLFTTAFMEQATPGNFTNGPGQISAYKAGLAERGQLNFQAIEEMAKAFKLKPQVGSVDLQARISHGPLEGMPFGRVLSIILLCFLLGAAGKSAQLPLYVWLPDAMAGPTPVSALIHAATMVTSGLYLFCRLSYLVVLSPTAMAAIVIIGGCTALLAAMIAFAQDDIKKVLAYSTVSQLGIMFMGIGAGLFWAAFLHVVTHAFFKACLFLGAGSVMHGNGDETDIKKLGGIKSEMKWTRRTFLTATLAITGVLPFSGFFSKDAILHAVHSTELAHYPHVMHLMWFVGLATALCTAFYMTRVYYLTFEGTRSPDAKVKHAHESSSYMTVPLMILAALSVLALVYGFPFVPTMAGGYQTVMENFLSPVFQTADHIAATSGFFERVEGTGRPWGAWGTAWAIALAGAGAAFYVYSRVFKVNGAGELGSLSFLQKLAQNKFYVDEFYELMIIRPVKFLSFIFFKVIDTMMIDTLAVRGTAWLTSRVADVLRLFQTGDAQSYAAVMVVALAGGVLFAIFGGFP